MARRKKSSDGGGVGPLILIGLIAIVKPLLVVMMNVLPLVGLPLLLIFLRRASRKRDAALANPANRIPDPDSFDWDESKVKIHAASLFMGKRVMDAKSIYELEHKVGVRLTDASGGRRFDQRTKYGATLNQWLDVVEEEISYYKNMRSEERRLVSLRVPDYRGKHEAIVGTQASWRAADISLWIYAGVFVAILLLRPSWVQPLSSLVASAFDGFRFLFAPAAVATVVAWLAFLMLRWLFYRRLDETTHVHEVGGWERIESEIRSADFFEGVELVVEPGEEVSEVNELVEVSSEGGSEPNEKTDYSEAREFGRRLGREAFRKAFESIKTGSQE